MDIVSELKSLLKGEVYTDDIFRSLYATDASVYREIPLGVAFPSCADDLQKIILWASSHGIALIPRAAGTSLAGQVVGSGLVVDTGRYMNRILEINKDERTVWVEPGVIRDDLNRVLKTLGLHFAPETSTSNRCMIAGMVGNNACGAHSLLYGSTRDHLLEVKGFLADGSPFHTKPITPEAFHEHLLKAGREGDIYRFIKGLLDDKDFREEMEQTLPWPEIRRRNTGYALDILMQMQPWNAVGAPFNLSKLIAGSEGTLMMISAVKLSLENLPPPVMVLLCPHFQTLQEAFEANLIALRHPVSSVELIDKVILTCTANHPGLRRNRFFIQGSPGAVLLIELFGGDHQATVNLAHSIAADISNAGYGYHFPVITGADIEKVWELRKAGLGLLSNVEGPARPVSVIEDTAVRPQDLPAYMCAFARILEELGLSCVYYAHISTGELHLKPLLDLKDPEHVKRFREVAERTAHLVRQFRGSLSGEHGDGRLRGEFIPWITGEKIYRQFEALKAIFDHKGILNPGKITGTLPMDSSLRYSGRYTEPSFTPFFDYTADGGFLRAVERCNGSGDCRRPWWHGGVMCPSYQASLDERFSTRGRSNLIRESLTRPGNAKPFADPALKEILDQCLACKGCKLECPSAVDMARFKAEVMHQYYHHHKTPLSVTLLTRINRINRLFVPIPGLYNALINLHPVSMAIKRIAGIHPRRDLPHLSHPILEKWLKRNRKRLYNLDVTQKGKVIFYVDEFTNFFDAPIGIQAVELLLALGYMVTPFIKGESGRAAFSKGKLKYARTCAERNVARLKNLVGPNLPLVGIEPSTILAFKDEYPDIVLPHLASEAKHVAAHTFLIEDFLVREYAKGNITAQSFKTNTQSVVYHGHCHQKSVCPSDSLKRMLEIPEGYSAESISSGCCGMAGSFGMEKKNYALSMKIGELVLFPFVRNLPDGTVIAMPGASCRQQLFDGTGRKALHPVEILYNALK